MTQKKRILVVDDTEVILMYQRLALGPAYEYDTAKNGRLALEAVRRRMPDLILLDLQMADMDGLQFLRELRSHEEWQEVPVIVVTTKNTPTHVKAAYDAGCTDFLAKPIDKVDLMKKVRRCLGDV